MNWMASDCLDHCRRIFCNGLTRTIVIGIYEHEKKSAQPVVFDVSVFVPDVPSQDQIGQTFDYDAIAAAVDRAAAQPCALVETLIDRIADTLLGHPLVKAVCVRCEKTALGPDRQGCGVEVFRTK